MTDIASATNVARGTREFRFAAIAPTALAFAVAGVIRLFSHLNNDVSWLLILGEKTATGARPYVDFLEVNPPASIFLYYPAVLIGHALGIAPEAVVNVMVFAAAGASLTVCALLVREAGLVGERDIGKLGGVAAFVLLVLPFYVFAQREHFATIAILPMLCVYAARASGRKIRPLPALAAGLAGGMAVVIKPHFVLALALPFAFVLWNRREAREFYRLIFATENLAALGTSVAYVALVFWQFPVFLHDEMPLVATVYVPVRLSLLAFLATPSCFLFAVGALTAALLCGDRIREPLFAVPFLGAFGFIAAAIVQGKGWIYHVYPAVALALLVAGNLSALISRSRMSAMRIFSFAFLALLTFVSCYWFSRNGEKPAVLEALQRRHIPHPKVLIVWGDMYLGHPLTRALGGSWAGTACSMWITDNANYLLARGGLDKKTVQAMERYKAQDRALIVSDIERNRPDIVLIGNRKWHDMAMSHPDLRAALGAYRNAETVNGTEIWLRKSGV